MPPQKHITSWWWSVASFLWLQQNGTLKAQTHSTLRTALRPKGAACYNRFLATSRRCVVTNAELFLSLSWNFGTNYLGWARFSSSLLLLSTQDGCGGGGKDSNGTRIKFFPTYNYTSIRTFQEKGILHAWSSHLKLGRHAHIESYCRRELQSKQSFWTNSHQLSGFSSAHKSSMSGANIVGFQKFRDLLLVSSSTTIPHSHIHIHCILL